MFRQLFDETSHTYTYLLGDSATGEAVLIDPVLGQEDRDLQVIEELGLRLTLVLETHVHADHITAAANLKDRTGCGIAYPATGKAEGADRYLAHGEVVTIGSVALETRHTPGHTAGSASYVQHDADRVFTGDTLLIRGCGRTDFQEGDSGALYRSVHEQLFSLPNATAVYPGHDYRGRTVSSIGEEKTYNPRLGNGQTADAFQATMEALDLAYPKMIDVAVPANRKLGRVPDAWGELERDDSGAIQAPIDWVQSHASQVRLIDVREPGEFHGPMGHVPDAELVPLGSLAHHARTWEPEAPLVLICRSGRRSERGALTLEAMGFNKVASMTGGTLLWTQGIETGSCG